jgi:hypothetical protein
MPTLWMTTVITSLLLPDKYCKASVLNLQQLPVQYTEYSLHETTLPAACV